MLKLTITKDKEMKKYYYGFILLAIVFLLIGGLIGFEIAKNLVNAHYEPLLANCSTLFQYNY